MNDVEELKQYIGVHAEGQDLRGYHALLDRIRHDEGGGPGSWCGEWRAEGERLERAGKLLEASRHYIMARFPYVDGAARQEAYERSLTVFERWAGEQRIRRVDVMVEGHPVGCWFKPAPGRPLVVVTGGFLTVKEQWAPALAAFARLGLAPLVTEMPAVGENEVPYDAKSGQFLSGLLDALGEHVDVSRTYALMMSFSGHLALQAARHDPRIRGVVTAGAPVREFFLDPAWQRGLPRVTVDTLEHLAGVPLPELAERALSADDLAGIDVPLAYVWSRRDEVIPPGDLDLLRRHVRDLDVLEHDDVHGSPSHVTETKLWMGRSLLRMQGQRGPRMLMLEIMWRMARRRG